jgi:hypothetical protein
VFLHSLENRQAILNLSLDLVILVYKLGTQFQNIVEKLFRDNNNPFKRVTEDDIALPEVRKCKIYSVFLEGKLTVFTVTPLKSMGTFRRPAFASAPVPTVVVALDHT